ncbi:hypothetical protein [Parvularcula sp. LCG005]|uniref:hypothetical protein n=1 Tax=Parvularcula sp. LCG005 TaxID=3078805 RepID=UPI002943AC19|nr:hypothetical protein [Parvularcula sp. LCG005]WOI51959.1 hypothetical protein RUI03_07295 [Parvularcula sp. LCG005]
MIDLPPPQFIEITCEGAELTETGARCPIPQTVNLVPEDMGQRYDLSAFCASYSAEPVPNGWPRIVDRIEYDGFLSMLPDGPTAEIRLVNAMAGLMAYKVELTAYGLYLENCTRPPVAVLRGPAE